jgi:DNA-directed RNA polymerase subunit omega
VRRIGILAGGKRAGYGVIRYQTRFSIQSHTALGTRRKSYVSTSQTDASLAAVPDQFDPASGGIGSYDTPLGITNPPIDELLERVSSKYALVIYAAKRARQINDYYNQLGEGILEYVGPLVEPGLQEKPLSIALREIHGDLLEHTEGE